MKPVIEVELCGKLADMVETAVKIPVPAGGFEVREFLKKVASTYPALSPLLASGRVRACVNEEIAADDTRITSGDLVALFPPVSGG